MGESCSHYLKNNYKLILSGIAPLANSIKLDITDQQSVNNFLEKNNPDVIINLAAFTDVDKCELEEKKAYEINFNGVKNLCKNFSGHFIQISTDYVFDGMNGPYNEDDKTNPMVKQSLTLKIGLLIIIPNQQFYVRMSFIVIHKKLKRVS